MAQIILWNSNAASGRARPLGPHALSHWLRLHGYTVKVIDFCSFMTTTQLVDVTRKNIDTSTIAIGVSTSFWNEPASILYNSLDYNSELISAAIDDTTQVDATSRGVPQWVTDARDKIDQSSTVEWILGGWNSNVPSVYKWTRFSGFAEDSLLRYLDEKKSVKQTRNPFDIVTGTCGMFDESSDIKHYEILPIELGRGCQFKCSFCSYPLIGKKKGTYLKNMAVVKQEFLRNFEMFGVTKYTVIDDTANESKEKIEELATLAQSLPFKLEWVGYNRLDLIYSYHQEQTLRDSGLRSAMFGIESFNKDASKIVGKPWNGIHAKDYLIKLREIWKNDITFALGFIVGLPGSEKDEANKERQWCIEHDMHSWIFSPLAVSNFKSGGSEFDRNAVKHGFVFPIKNGAQWTNGIWSKQEANAIAVEMRKQSVEYVKNCGFQTLSPISSGLMSFNQLAVTKFKDLRWDKILAAQQAITDSYVTSQLKK